MISSSKVIKLPGSLKQINAVSDKVNKYLQDEELKKVIEQKIERVQKKAYEEGFAKGLEQGKHEGKQRYEAAIQTVKAIVDEMNAYIDTFHKEMEQENISLAFALSKKIIRKELSAAQELSQIIRDTFHKIPEKRGILIRLHQSSQKHIDELKKELENHNVPLDQIEIETDASVEQGGCYIETDSAVVDGRIETIVLEVEKRLQELAQWEPNS